MKKLYVIAGVLALQLSNVQALNIVFDYSAFDTGPTASAGSILINDAWSGATPDSTRLEAAKSVMNQAASYWENTFAGCSALDFTHNISVGWDALPGETVAQGGASWSGGPGNPIISSFINWDTDASSSFFVDTTPGSNSEFSASPNDTRTTNLGGINLNVEDRWYANFLGTDAADNNDMLTVAMHEIMHTLGVLSAYPNYTALDIDNDGSFFELMAAGITIPAAYDGGHVEALLAWNGPGSLPGDYHPNLIGPNSIPGTRSLITDLDALLLANLYGQTEHDCINQPHGTIPVPEPTSAFLVLFSLATFTLRRGRSNC